MDFEQKLADLVESAMSAGVAREDIISEMEMSVHTLRGEKEDRHWDADLYARVFDGLQRRGIPA